MNTGNGKVLRTGFRTAGRGVRAGAASGPAACLALGVATALALALAACQGGGQERGNGRISVDIRPLVQQMGGSTGASAQGAGSGAAPQGAVAPQSANAPLAGPITGPGSSAATTDVLTLVIGAVAIGFQDTPLGADSAITDALKDDLQQAALDSTQFVTLAQLPTNDPFVEFDVPPPAAIHWQIVVVGLRDTVRYLNQAGGTSPIYYGFSQDAAGHPTFLSAKTAGDAPIDVLVKRACVVSAPPNGCAQYKPDRTLVITPAVEIVGVYLNGSTTNVLLPASALIVRNSTDVTSAISAINAIIGSAMSVRIDTTHQLSPANAGNAACVADTLSGLYGALPGATTSGFCSVESYTTNF